MSQSFTTASCRDLSYVKAEFLSWAVREVLEEGQESGASRPLFALLGGGLGQLGSLQFLGGAQGQ